MKNYTKDVTVGPGTWKQTFDICGLWRLMKPSSQVTTLFYGDAILAEIDQLIVMSLTHNLTGILSMFWHSSNHGSLTLKNGMNP